MPTGPAVEETKKVLNTLPGMDRMKSMTADMKKGGRGAAKGSPAKKD